MGYRLPLQLRRYVEGKWQPLNGELHVYCGAATVMEKPCHAALPPGDRSSSHVNCGPTYKGAEHALVQEQHPFLRACSYSTPRIHSSLASCCRGITDRERHKTGAKLTVKSQLSPFKNNSNKKLPTLNLFVKCYIIYIARAHQYDKVPLWN